LSYNVFKQCFIKKRIGAAFSIAPLLNHPVSKDDEQPISSLDIDESTVNNNIQLVAFGALEKIIVAMIKPKPKEILTIEKPEYIESGTVPYLDWGKGLSPSYRDKSYSILAIAWGKIL
jgi:hypothetical protein